MSKKYLPDVRLDQDLRQAARYIRALLLKIEGERARSAKLLNFIEQTEGYMSVACWPDQGARFVEWDELRESVIAQHEAGE